MKSKIIVVLIILFSFSVFSIERFEVDELGMTFGIKSFYRKLNPNKAAVLISFDVNEPIHFHERKNVEGMAYATLNPYGLFVNDQKVCSWYRLIADNFQLVKSSGKYAPKGEKLEVVGLNDQVTAVIYCPDPKLPFTNIRSEILEHPQLAIEVEGKDRNLAIVNINGKTLYFKLNENQHNSYYPKYNIGKNAFLKQQNKNVSELVMSESYQKLKQGISKCKKEEIGQCVLKYLSKENFSIYDDYDCYDAIKNEKGEYKVINYSEFEKCLPRIKKVEVMNVVNDCFSVKEKYPAIKIDKKNSKNVAYIYGERSDCMLVKDKEGWLISELAISDNNALRSPDH